MNSILKKINSGYRRIKNGFHVALFPDDFYLYNKKKYLYHNLSYSQEGEDMIIQRFFKDKINGFYVDVGAHHPQRFSNTYHFYLQGWRGINIDAMPGSMDIFNKVRPNDINLEYAIFDRNENLIYYEFNDPALNGFCDKISYDRHKLSKYKIISQQKIETYTLAEILDKYLDSQQEIDFINIDVEGLDLKVLNSNEWKKYRPKLVLVEDLNVSSLSIISDSKVASFMHEQDYQLYAKSINTLIFITKT